MDIIDTEKIHAIIQFEKDLVILKLIQSWKKEKMNLQSQKI